MAFFVLNINNVEPCNVFVNNSCRVSLVTGWLSKLKEIAK
ncbi:hypothetical protein JCM19235_5808 [Vibrio maritimus]|uniref:Uncharacterized protein n=1 Tax=Vibrio maritimus TaxID=990268 RepID=A0A090RSQ1_9VIBR|nr:hypothetical protein JCM19235_5808 [Vibrio maritimus]